MNKEFKLTELFLRKLKIENGWSQCINILFDDVNGNDYWNNDDDGDDGTNKPH